MHWLRKIMEALNGAAADQKVGTECHPPEAGIVVGAGADNEVQMHIGGEPHLFVDEGAAIVHFVSRFEVEVRRTVFGPKLLPSVQPYWLPCKRHADATLSEVIEQVLRGTSPSPVPKAAAQVVDQFLDQIEAEATDLHSDAKPMRPAAKSRTDSGMRKGGSYVGTILTWGEEVFPDRKRPGETYRSFAVRLQTAEREETLQGEGLKDAIAEAKAEVGNHVEIRRLRKVKVPAFRKNGEPKLDAHGQQIQHDKWLWAINQSN